LNNFLVSYGRYILEHQRVIHPRLAQKKII
jgi:hypothetical protein